VSGPFIFVGTHRIKTGKLEDFKRDCDALVRLVERAEPRMLAFNFFFSEDEQEASVIQIHPDADSMLFHMKTMREQIELSVDEQLITKEIQIFGPPNEAVRQMIGQLTQAGVPISVKPLRYAGFTRLAAQSAAH